MRRLSRPFPPRRPNPLRPSFRPGCKAAERTTSAKSVCGTAARRIERFSVRHPLTDLPCAVYVPRSWHAGRRRPSHAHRSIYLLRFGGARASAHPLRAHLFFPHPSFGRTGTLRKRETLSAPPRPYPSAALPPEHTYAPSELDFRRPDRSSPNQACLRCRCLITHK